MRCIESWLKIAPPSRLFHGVDGEPALDSSLLTIRLAEERKPKPASDGNHQMTWGWWWFIITHGRTVWLLWSALSWKCQKHLRIEIWPPLFGPHAHHHLGAGEGVSWIIFDGDQQLNYPIIILCHIWNIRWGAPSIRPLAPLSLHPASKVTSKAISLSILSDCLTEDCRQLKKVSGSLGQAQLLVSSHERSKNLQNAMIWRSSPLSFSSLSSTSPSSSWPGATLCPRDLWGHEGLQVGIKRAEKYLLAFSQKS